MRRKAALIALLSMILVWGAGYGVYRFLAYAGGLSRGAVMGHDALRHDHQSQHGGTVRAIGENHIECGIEKGGRLHVYLLGKDETELKSIAARELQAQVEPQGEIESTPVILRAIPQAGEAAGTASHFAGRAPPQWSGRPLAMRLIVPISGRRYLARFEMAAHSDPAMPAALGSEAERGLFLTPGGIYTDSDIRANGGIPPSLKYQGFHAVHNMHPMPGDKICPITQTLANPKLSWIIGGKSYTFCCPPCLEEFVSRAKKNPKTILPPDRYVKR